MVNSMTAFARREATADWGSMSVELRSVNHRYLELSPRFAEELRVLEPKFREKISHRLKRGKLDVSLRWQATGSSDEKIIIDTTLAEKIAKYCANIDKYIANPSPISSLELLRWPGVMRAPETDIQQLHQQAMDLLDLALDDLLENRQREGHKLAEIITSRCDSISQIVKRVRSRLPQVNMRIREKILARIADMKVELDENRFAQELAFMAQKIDVDEEMDRLDTHICEVRRVLGESKAIGRRLDFLMQELNREANTLGSKSVDIDTTNASVELKVLIEQIREQVQNIE